MTYYYVNAKGQFMTMAKDQDELKYWESLPATKEWILSNGILFQNGKTKIGKKELGYAILLEDSTQGYRNVTRLDSADQFRLSSFISEQLTKLRILQYSAVGAITALTPFIIWILDKYGTNKHVWDALRTGNELNKDQQSLNMDQQPLRTLDKEEDSPEDGGWGIYAD